MLHQMIEDAHKGKRQFLSGIFFFFPSLFDFSFGSKKGVDGTMAKDCLRKMY